MPLTRIESKAALKHVVVTVLYQDGPLMRSLTNEGIDNINDLMLLRSVMKLKYPAADGTLSAIRAGQHGPLTSLLCLR
jgi:hypothetical protein